MGKTRKRKVSAGRGKLINLKHKLFSSRYQDQGALHVLRSTLLSIKDSQSLMSSIPALYSKIIFQNALPKSYEEIGKTKTYVKAPGLLSELKWSVITFLYYKKELYSFLKMQNTFECCFLKGDYTKAEQALNNIETDISFSLWGLEQRFFILEYMFGLEKNKEFLSEINNKRTLWVILVILAEHLSNKAEKKMSVMRHQEYLSRFLSDYEEHKDLYDYFNYKLNVLSYEDCDNLDFILYIENMSSVIDRYLAFKKCYQFICARDLMPNEKDKLLSLLNMLRKEIDDPDLTRIALYLDPDEVLYKDRPTELFLSISDEYTRGNYDKALVNCKEAIYHHPNSIELCLLYIKCLIYSRAKFERLFENRNVIIDNALEDLYCILVRADESLLSFQKLDKIAYSLSSYSWAFKIYILLRKEFEPSYNDSLRCLSMLLSKVHNVKQARAYKDSFSALSFLQSLRRIYGNKLTIRFWENIERQIVDKEFKGIDIDVVEPRKRVYEAKLHQYLGDYRQAIVEYEDLIRTAKLVGSKSQPHLYENVVFNLYNCLMANADYPDAIKLSVETYILNKNMTLRFDLEKLVAQIESSGNELIFSNIYTSILFVYASQPVNKIYVAYDNYLTSLGAKRPSDLFERNTGDRKYLIYRFLFEVCTIEVMYKSIFFSGTDDIEEERLRVLQYLAVQDKANEKIYTEEINTLTKRRIVRKGIQQVGESKVFVDIDGIRNISEKSITESFNRYLEFSTFDIEEFKLLNNISTGTVIAWSSSPEDKEQVSEEDIVFSSNIKAALFIEMFYELRDRFIFSNEYGLDSYLSIRIRHGTLSGQLRKPFETEHLITQKDKITDEYFDNNYWDSRLVLYDEEKIALLHKALTDLSRKIDEIIRKFREEWIQISTDANPTEGFFDFTFTDSELLVMFKDWYAEIRQSDAFINRVLGDLLERTEAILGRFRKHIITDVKTEIINYLDQLSSALNDIGGDFRQSGLSSAIASCKTSIQNELDRISEWFRFSSDKGFDKFNLELAIATSKEMINNTCQNEFKPFIDIKRDIIISGRYFTYFVDMFYIILDNVVKHSGHLISEITSNLMVDVEGSQLSVKMTNDLSDDVDIDAKTERIKDVATQIKTKAAIDKTSKEGGTGLIKIQKILLYDLNRKKYSINPSVDDNLDYKISIETDLEGILYESTDY